MKQNIRYVIIYIKLVWYHVIYWIVGELDETYFSQLATAYFYLHKYKKAISLYEKSEKAHNRADGSYSKYNFFYLGYCYLNLGDFIKAAEYFEKYMKYHSDNVDILGKLSLCYMQINQPSEALRICNKGSELEKDSPAWDLESARIYHHLGKNDKASKFVTQAKTKANELNEKELIGCFEHKIAGKLTKAIDGMRNLINQAKSSSYYEGLDGLYGTLSNWQKEAGDNAGALSTLEEAYRIIPSSAVKNQLALEYADRDINLDEALKIINEALHYHPDDSIFLDTKGWILYKMGKKEEARHEIERSLTLNPDCKDTLEHYEIIKT